MNKAQLEYRVAMAIHRVAKESGACGNECDHIDEARAVIGIVRRELAQRAHRRRVAAPPDAGQRGKE